MNERKYIEKFVQNCKIFYGKDLISEEQIMKKYLFFFSNQFENEERKISFSLHTGSLCFDVIAIVAITLGSIAYNMSNNDEIIASFRIGDLVLYRNSRYRWRGISECNGKKYLALEQDGKGKNGKNIVYSLYETNKHLVKPYYGKSKRTDSRGIRKESNSRKYFLGWLLEIPEQEIPSEFDISVVIVANRERFFKIVKNTKIVYEDKREVGLLDIVPASYYTGNGEEYSIGQNSTKAEAVLKVTGKLSEARNLILSKHLNKAVGLLVMDAEGSAKDGSELSDLLGRKILHFAHVMGPLKTELGQEIVELYNDADVFVCTKEFLRENSSSIQIDNFLTRELSQQISNIIATNMHQIIIKTNGWNWEEYFCLKNELNKIRQSNWKYKEEFTIASYALINLFNTAVFPMRVLEDAVYQGKLNTTIISPKQHLEQINELKERAESLYDICKRVTDILEKKYNELSNSNAKKDYLETYLKENRDHRIAIVVPKAYYVTLLDSIYGEMFLWRKVSCFTVSKYDMKECYENILVVGNLSNRKFDALQCNASHGVDIILYPCEEKMFSHQREKVSLLSEKLNNKQGVHVVKTNVESNNIDDELAEEMEKEFLDMDQYIESMNLYQFRQFIDHSSSSITGAINAEVQVIGRFVTGEQIFFSKFYNPIVYDPDSGTVSEVKVDQLESGDILIFVKRDNYTSNVVDFIYDELIIQNKLNENVVNSTEMANYWKQILRAYKENGGYTYQEIASQMKSYGSSLQAVTIRQWLMEDSHIVGPRDEETMHQIALLTRDEKLNKNVHTCFEACKVVRHQRKKILNLIGQAITDKFTGNQPPKDSTLSIVYDNVESLSEAMELDAIFHLDEVINVPINLANRPITETEEVLL